jgi:hypothetical protein
MMPASSNQPADSVWVPTEEAIEANADRMLKRLLKGARVHPVGLTTPEFREGGRKDPCRVCDSGKVLSAYGARQEHAVCLACTRATKHFQRAIDQTLRTLEEQRKFVRQFRLSELKRRAAGQRIGKGRARPNAAKKLAVMAAVRSGLHAAE